MDHFSASALLQNGELSNYTPLGSAANEGAESRFPGLTSNHARLSWRDALTALPDRRLLYAAIDAGIAANRPMVLLLADLDHFKEINDCYGHDAGDAVILAVARRLKSACRPQDLVARIGGDEFAILMQDIHSPADALSVATRMLQSCCGSVRHGELSLEVQFTAGLCLHPVDASDRLSLYQLADVALYHGKENGRGRVEVFSPTMKERVDRRNEEVLRARRALSEGSLPVVYQPIVAVADQTIVGVEVLLRVRDNTTGAMSSAHTINEAFSQRSLALEIGAHVARQAFEQARAWEQDGKDVGFLTINVTEAELQTPAWASSLLALADQYAVPTRKIHVEVHESVFFGRKVDCVRENIHALHAAGVPIVLDDFGTGFASLGTLRDYPIDTVKIDQSFISAMNTPDNAAIVKALIDLCGNLNLNVIAEGVETSFQHELLNGWGCKFAQGFYYCHPVPSTKLC